MTELSWIVRVCVSIALVISGFWPQNSSAECSGYDVNVEIEEVKAIGQFDKHSRADFFPEIYIYNVRYARFSHATNQDSVTPDDWTASACAKKPQVRIRLFDHDRTEPCTARENCETRTRLEAADINPDAAHQQLNLVFDAKQCHVESLPEGVTARREPSGPNQPGSCVFQVSSAGNEKHSAEVKVRVEIHRSS